MIYFEASELIYAVLASVMLGAIFGALYSSFGEFYSFFIFSFKSLYFAVLNCHHISIKRIKDCILNKNKNISRITKEILDFLFFISFGCSLILITYVTLDGALRIFIPLTALMVFWIINKALGLPLSKFIKVILNTVLIAYALVSETILHYPIILINLLNRKIRKMTLSFAGYILKRRSNRITEKKIRETKKYLETYIK